MSVQRIVLALILSALIQPVMAEYQVLQDEARQQVKVFAKALKHTLQTGIQEKGLLESIGMCHSQAPEISNSLSQNGWKMSRTAVKFRNEKNQPDEWEQMILASFETRLANGDDIKVLEASKLENGVFHYMKAIPTGQVCLNCHGHSITPELADRLDELYPNDKARGFSVGQLRGAFSLSKQLAD